MPEPAVRMSIRLAEVLAALALATDLGMGQPMEHVLRQCLIALPYALSAGKRRARRATWPEENAHSSSMRASANQVPRMISTANLGVGRRLPVTSRRKRLEVDRLCQHRAQRASVLAGNGPGEALAAGLRDGNLLWIFHATRMTSADGPAHGATDPSSQVRREVTAPMSSGGVEPADRGAVAGAAERLELVVPCGAEQPSELGFEH